MATTGIGSSPCGACKFLRRKCTADCIFAPHFRSEQGAARFAAIHKVFGASNVSKLLLHVPVADRCEAVITIAYEAQARLRDPVHGCVSHIFALQQQVAYLQAQLMQVKAQIAQNLLDRSSTNAENHCQWSAGSLTAGPNLGNNMNYYSISPQSPLDSIFDQRIDGIQSDVETRDHELVSFQPYSKKRHAQTDLSELQELAFRMMNDETEYY